MQVLVLNAGSSSLKAQLLEMPAGTPRLTAQFERLGTPEAQLRMRWLSRSALAGAREDAAPYTLSTALAFITEILQDPKAFDLPEWGPVDAVGHRVVHGGSFFRETTVLDSAAEAALRRCVPLAPLHNPANLEGLSACREAFPEAPQVAVLDTAFHQTLPPEAATYPLPSRLRDPDSGPPLRRYGFHGTSHQYVLREVARTSNRAPEALNLISFHLGNGCSAAAIRQGRCVETTMGLTPLGGVMMGTRPGDLDPGVLLHLLREGIASEELDHVLNRESGLKGLAGTNDLRDVLALRDSGSADAALAIDVFLHHLRKTLGALWAVLGQVHAVAFTGGIGEHAPEARSRLLEGLEEWGVELDLERNQHPGSGVVALQRPSGRVAIWVVPANEELAIAQEVFRILQVRTATASPD
ncbi:MAG: acetate/propionate family kinase [bacterium]